MILASSSVRLSPHRFWLLWLGWRPHTAAPTHPVAIMEGGYMVKLWSEEKTNTRTSRNISDLDSNFPRTLLTWEKLQNKFGLRNLGYLNEEVLLHLTSVLNSTQTLTWHSHALRFQTCFNITTSLKSSCSCEWKMRRAFLLLPPLLPPSLPSSLRGLWGSRNYSPSSSVLRSWERALGFQLERKASSILCWKSFVSSALLELSSCFFQMQRMQQSSMNKHYTRVTAAV